eukprot:Protomagalhaensia_wolfi_Nauph_80__1894@NODE_218_length_3152_cov_86_466110_g164_i0_p5_GENE_NODE_218_length_3152_cov_86_466110_g164_i0NODE_218_length_3152_cov_86_466110_g164_i0_p5_ORF_typecomplete_len100_score9_92Kelch_3/PF13415_6/0_42Kelch_3/PF13415_6/75DUF1349/PF07081_11/0_083_NODE_218_length_3152_cov_86_466110_g164_i0695994
MKGDCCKSGSAPNMGQCMMSVWCFRTGTSARSNKPLPSDASTKYSWMKLRRQQPQPRMRTSRRKPSLLCSLLCSSGGLSFPRARTSHSGLIGGAENWNS